MLNLAAPTDPAWVARALEQLDEVLVDHAHCEKKAASTAVSLLFRYTTRTELLIPLTRLAREELAHFEQVLEHLEARGIAFGHREPAPYAGELLRAVRPTEPHRLLDTLLCLSLIEARSCERMQLLASAVTDQGLAGFYRSLLASEARHHATYVDLATKVAPEPEVRSRLRELALHEAAVLATMPATPRFHT